MKDTTGLKPVKIDDQTTIFVSKCIPDDVARRDYLNKRIQTEVENKRQADGSKNKKKSEEIPEDPEEIIEYDLDEFENMDD